jgi:hypothetical protein
VFDTLRLLMPQPVSTALRVAHRLTRYVGSIPDRGASSGAAAKLVMRPRQPAIKQSPSSASSPKERQTHRQLATLAQAPLDFLLMAIDGFQVRLDTMQATLDALRATVQRATERAGLQPPVLTQASQPAKKPRKKVVWTDEMRAAQAKRISDRWKKGAFGPRKKAKA